MVAISGCAKFKHGSPGVVDMRQAMEECDGRTNDHYLSGASATIRDFRFIASGSFPANGAHVCSLPLIADEQVIGVISIRTVGGQTASRSELLDQLNTNGRTIQLAAEPRRPC